MSDKQALIEEILNCELAMFVSVPARYPAPCQSDPDGFRTTRSAQFSVWSEEALASYLDDLRTAAEQGRNLMTIKYARMENLVPELHDDPLVENVIEQVVAAQLQWQRELAARYPNLIGRGRPLEDGEDAAGATSFVTYLRGELETYSANTLACLFRDVSEAMARGENLTEGVYREMVRNLGYRSIEDAEARIREGRA
jgi:hypothetical protein